jgi:hypothetical protein
MGYQATAWLGRSLLSAVHGGRPDGLPARVSPACLPAPQSVVAAANAFAKMGGGGPPGGGGGGFAGAVNSMMRGGDPPGSPHMGPPGGGHMGSPMGHMGGPPPGMMGPPPGAQQRSAGLCAQLAGGNLAASWPWAGWAEQPWVYRQLRQLCSGWAATECSCWLASLMDASRQRAGMGGPMGPPPDMMYPPPGVMGPGGIPPGMHSECLGGRGRTGSGGWGYTHMCG